MEPRHEDIGNIVSQYGMEYGKAIILERALPNIDGFKPSQRRVLYTMKRMGATKDRKMKCARIAGQVLTYHPHGDTTAYQTMVAMTDKNGSYSVPYVAGKGSFGKAYARDLDSAHPRYTEAGLSKIAEELFDGMTEGASNMVPNFDNTELEPELLPVKFPTILVNPIVGIAFAKSCNIPPFALTNVCMATAGIAAGKITNAEELVDIIGCPNYTTGGIIHYSRKTMEEICKTGKGKVIISGTADVYSDRIEINEIPYTTTAEQIVDEITTLVKEGKFNEISRVHNGVSRDGMKIKVFIKRGHNSRDALDKLYRMTSFRESVSYRIKVVYNNECKDDVGVFDVLNMWLEYRHNCIINQTKYRLTKLEAKHHELRTWEIIKDRIQEVGAEIPKRNQTDLEEWFRTEFGLDSVQIDYLLSMQSRSITKDNMIKNIEQLRKIEQDIKECEGLINNKEDRNRYIIADMQRISEKYGEEPKSRYGEEIVEKKEAARKINNDVVTIKYTKNGYIKRLTDINDVVNFKCPVGDRVLRTFQSRNNEYILVFTYDGEMYKILTDDIDSSKGGLKQSVVDTLKLESASKVLWVDTAGDFTGYFNMVYPNGKGERVHYDKAAGNRMKYISVFKPAEIGKAWITQEDKFFIITAKRHASYVDLTHMGIFSSSRVFRGATMKTGDNVVGVQPLNKVPDISTIDIERYKKPYTVSIGADVLWDNSEQQKIREEKKRQEQERKELLRQEQEKQKMKQLDKLFESIVTDDVEFYE